METGEIHGTARMIVHDGKLSEFTELIERCIELVREHDTGTIEYDLFLDADRRVCFVHERYRNSAVGLVHMVTIGPLSAALAEVCSITGEVCGGRIPSTIRRSRRPA